MKHWHVLIDEVQADEEQAAVLSLRVRQLLEELKMPGRVQVVEEWYRRVVEAKPPAYLERGRDPRPGLMRRNQ